MDFNSPRRINIGDSTYRFREQELSFFHGDLNEEACFDKRPQGEEEWSPEEEKEWRLEYLSQDRYKAIVEIPSSFFGYLIGKRGASKREMESEYRVKLTFPSNTHSQEDEVTIHGETKNIAMRACRRILLKSHDLRAKADWTHFICVPLWREPQFMEHFKDFKSRVSLREPNLDEGILQRPQRLHLTIGVMTLLTQQEINLAKKTLDESLHEIIKPLLGSEELILSAKGLQLMNDDPSSTNVLYAVIKSEKLQKISYGILTKFASKGIIQNDLKPVTLHMTLMNTKFLGQSSGNNQRLNQNKSRPTFDATRILQDFANEDFGVSKIKEIHLCEMGGSKNTREGNYVSSHVLSI
uniref:Activating signal cointegrator 1 complex subunit 1 n=1 Tax=Caligus rogercresseyi TaxID=217165 RepID=C1BMT7_CALRO|nr:Activating signal cointegrator 1 complex subunit 1 [Caligus rogercresseyi]